MKSTFVYVVSLAFITGSLLTSELVSKKTNEEVDGRVKRQAVTWRLKDLSLLDNLAKDILMLKRANSHNTSSDVPKKRIIAKEVQSINEFNDINPLEDKSLQNTCNGQSCSTENSFRQRFLHKNEPLSSHIMHRLRKKPGPFLNRIANNQVNLEIPDIYEMQFGLLPKRGDKRPLRSSKNPSKKQSLQSQQENKSLRQNLFYNSPTFISLGAIREFQKNMNSEDILVSSEDRILAPPTRPVGSVQEKRETEIKKHLQHRRPIKLKSRRPGNQNKPNSGPELQSAQVRFNTTDKYEDSLRNLAANIIKSKRQRGRRKRPKNRAPNTKLPVRSQTSRPKIPNFIPPISSYIEQKTKLSGKITEQRNNAYFPPSNNFTPKLNKNTSSDTTPPKVTYFSPSSAIGFDNDKQFTPIRKYKTPSLKYSLPSREHSGPNTKYSPPSKLYQTPNVEYSSAANLKPPKSRYQVPSRLYQPPTLKYQPGSKEFVAPRGMYGNTDSKIEKYKNDNIYGPPKASVVAKPKFKPSQPDYITPDKDAVEESKPKFPQSTFFKVNNTGLKGIIKNNQKYMPVPKLPYIPPVYQQAGKSKINSQEHPTLVELPNSSSHLLQELANPDHYDDSYDYYGSGNNNGEGNYYYDYVDYDFFRVVGNGSSNIYPGISDQAVIGDDQSFEYGYIAGIPGIAGYDYPVLNYIPQTIFRCHLVADYAGYYADMEVGCQVFHVCHIDGRQDSYLCPNGTVFNQKYFVCDWWYNFACDDAAFFYPINALIAESSNLYHDEGFFLS